MEQASSWHRPKPKAIVLCACLDRQVIKKTNIIRVPMGCAFAGFLGAIIYIHIVLDYQYRSMIL